MSPGWAFLGSTRSYSRSHLGAQALAVLSAERSRLASRGVPASRDGLLAVKASRHLNGHAACLPSSLHWHQRRCGQARALLQLGLLQRAAQAAVACDSRTDVQAVAARAAQCADVDALAVCDAFLRGGRNAGP